MLLYMFMIMCWFIEVPWVNTKVLITLHGYNDHFTQIKLCLQITSCLNHYFELLDFILCKLVAQDINSL